MENRKVYVGYDPEAKEKKPEKGEIVGSKRRAVDHWAEIDLEDLAELVGNKGHSMVPGHLVSGLKAENCTGMQLFALDFDQGITFKEIQSRCEQIQIPIAFAYHTFSSTPQSEKFRVVFAHDTLIEDVYVVRIVIAMLYRIFPECDSSCKNLDRIYLGGKELICCNSEARISLVQVYSVFYERLNNNENLRRAVRNFCNKYRILLIDGSAAMGDGRLADVIMSKIDGMKDSVIYHIIEESIFPSFFVIENRILHQTYTCKDKKKLRKVDIEDKHTCQLWNDFNNGVRLSHDARFMILTNMNYINGGVKQFFALLEKDYSEERCRKWEQDYKRDIKNYRPERCSREVCPYYEECENRGTIVDALTMGRKVYQKKETYVTLEEASICLEENLEQAFSYTGNGIHLIKAQTGLGKTRMYINWIEKHPQAKVLIAAPTNTLKKQIGEDLKSHGITNEELFITPSAHGNCFIPRQIQEKISYFHEAGLHGRTKSMIASYYQEIKDDPCMNAVAELCENLMKGAKGMEDKRVVVTTHAYLLQIPSELSSQYTVIIDEDILYLQILSNSHCVDVETLERLSEKRVPGLSGIAEEILATEEGIYIRREPLSAAMPFTEEQLSEYEICCDKENDVNDLFLAGAYIKEDDSQRGSVVHYFCPQKLPLGKYIVLSATLNEKIYRAYFKKDMKVISYPEKKAAYLGTLKQYSYHSLGRNDLKKKTEIFEFIREYSEDPDLPVLTFKKFENEAGRSCKGLHFGNLTGINDLKGRDIGIIGTPYKNEEAYKLPACYLGVDVNKKEDARPHYQRVTYKGNSFLMMAYSDELLREIQLYSLESELEQAVGRARLLRNPCTVYLFSPFPCEQAKIYMKDYLVEPPEKEEPKDKFRVKPGLCRKLPPLTLEEVRRHRNTMNHQAMPPIYAYPM